MTKPEFDITIEMLMDEVCLLHFTPAGEQYAEEILKHILEWEPKDVMANVPPNVRLGVRTCTRNKFALVPPHSLH